MSERIGCKYCNYKGYVKHSFFNGSKEEAGDVSVTVCSHCKDVRGYYAYVRNKYGTQKEKAEESSCKILDFNKFKQKKETGE